MSMRIDLRRRALVFVALLAAAAGCRHGDAPDAYGNFETTEIVVSAESSGQLLWFAPDDGARLAAGALVGVVDTTSLALERAQIRAQRGATTSRASEVGRQLGALEVQREIAHRTYERTRRLFDEQAATAQQLDQAEREYRVLVEQIQAMEAQRRTVGHDVASTDARIAQIDERIAKSRITNPLAGTVLATYAERGEVVQAGQPLYKIASLDSMILRAYVAETQLAHVRVGDRAQVAIDAGARREVVQGTVTWVSPQAEFTPTPIQTRDERKDLVYAVKIRVPNPRGLIKIGMPGDVRFAAATPES
jgi:HlyD family secretion protein